MLTVLVIDDDTDLVEMIRTALTASGISVCALTSGNGAIMTAREANPDVILLDIILGEMDGRSLCRAMKKDPAISHIPVVLYSAGHITQRSIEDCGASAFVPKPFDLFRLIDRLKQVARSPRTG